MNYLSKTFITLPFLIFIILTLIFINNPTNAAHGEEHEADVSEDLITSLELPYITEEGKLPGITWADDIHPIFIRNRCGECHTRNKEVYVDKLAEFALGIINPDDPSDPYYSYHELVYAEGPSQIREGEILRNGQCCWPSKNPPEDQRRIWIGHAGRSVLIRKVEGDYYDWNDPPRYLEEALSLKWGIPMPMFHLKEEEKSDGYKVRSILSRLIFKISLWFNRNKDELYELPRRIPVKDRTLLRYWINNSEQMKVDDTVIEVHAVNKKGSPVQDTVIQLFGNYNDPEQTQVRDIIELKTDEQGLASLSFPKWSVITSFWFVTGTSKNKKPEYKPIRVKSGEINRIKIIL